MIPLRAAMPSTVTNPTSDPSDSTPPVRNTLATPPMSAKGIVSATSATMPRGSEVDVQDQQDAQQRQRAKREQPALRLGPRRVLAEHLRVIAGVERHARRCAASMSRATAPRSRPRTLQVTSIRRDPPSRVISFGVGATCTSATDASGV